LRIEETAIQGNQRWDCDQREEAAATLTDSFLDDPLLNWWQGRHAARRRRMFEELVDKAEEVICQSGCGGVVFGARATKEPGWFGTLHAAAESTVAYARFTTPSRVWRLTRAAFALTQMQPCGDFLHLQYIAVAKELRGHGIGAVLLRDFADRADGLPCYLETASVERRRYFVGRGWTVISEAALPGGGPHLWGLSHLG
jgi:ribosomal protein S18 acetylase RimI-like enzyme